MADLPGVAREDVEVHFEKGVIQVRAQARAEEEPAPGRYLRRERGSHGLEWSLRVGEAVDVEGIRAHLDAGVLRVSLPKSEHLRPREIPVRSN